jgi:hypothetical protein
MAIEPQAFFLLVFELVKIAHPGNHLAHETGFELHHAGLAFEQSLAELREGVAVGSRQADPCNDNTVFTPHR